MGHWLFWYLTWEIWIRNEGVVLINMTEMSDIENDVVPPPLIANILLYISMADKKKAIQYTSLLICASVSEGRKLQT